MLPVERLEGKEEEHVMTISTKRSDCKYCSYSRTTQGSGRHYGTSQGCQCQVDVLMYTFVKNTLLLIILVVQR